MKAVIPVLAALVLAGCGSGGGQVKAGDVQDALARFDVTVVQAPDLFERECQNLQPRDADLDAYRAYGYFVVVVSGGKACDDFQKALHEPDANGRYWDDDHGIVSEPIEKNVWLHMVLGQEQHELGPAELAIEKIVRSAMQDV